MRRPVSLAAAIAVALAAAFAVPYFSTAAGMDPAEATASALDRGPSGLEQSPDAARRAPAELHRPRTARRPGFELAVPRGAGDIVLRTRPRGPIAATIAPRTEFGSRQTLGVVARRGDWIGVTTPALPNGRLGWVDLRRATVRLARTRMSLTLDLSERGLVLKAGGRVLRRMKVGVGRAESPTPKGRFSVTDKLSGSRYGSYYGCCIVALSARQPNLPPGWPGGDRIAIHGTNDPASIGVASSAGCPHASDADLRVLMRRVPLGAPVFVHA